MYKWKAIIEYIQLVQSDHDTIEARRELLLDAERDLEERMAKLSMYGYH